MKKAVLLLTLLPQLLMADVAPSDEQLARLDAIEVEWLSKHNPSGTLGSDFLVHADVFYWQARESGLQYALSANSPVPVLFPPTRLHLKNPDFDWDFGYRLGLGYQSEGGWDLNLIWTRFITDSKNRLQANLPKSFYAVWAHPVATADILFNFTFAKAKWTLRFNELDLLLGRNFAVTKRFKVHPFLGGTTVWINQHYHVFYSEILSFGFYHTKLKNEFWGAGLKTGCDLHFGLGAGWSLFGSGSASLYTGEFDLGRKERFSTIATPFTKVKFDQDLDAARLATALSMGIDWKNRFHGDRYYVNMRLMYELLSFFKQNEFIRVANYDPTGNSNASNTSLIKDSGPLVLHGGTLSVTFGF